MPRKHFLPFCFALILLTPYIPESAFPQASSWTQKGGSLGIDADGWAFKPSIAISSDGTIYAAWSQHRSAPVWEYSGTYVKCWKDGNWEQLGGRIGHVDGESGAGYPEGYHPSIAILGGVPYVAWYEGGGYGWNSTSEPLVFVSHWDGTQWVYDLNAEGVSGALNTSGTADGRDPVLAVINGSLYAAWIELRKSDNRNVIIVKHLQGSQWIQDGYEFSTNTANGGRIIALDLLDVSGVPHVAWSEFVHSYSSTQYTNSKSTVQVRKLSADSWIPVGGPLNKSAENYVGYIAAATVGAFPYIAWQERSSSGKSNIYVKHWNGSNWIADGDSLNADPLSGDAGRPALAADGSRVWMAWCEGKPGQKARLFVRSLYAGTWSNAEGSLNIDAVNGSAGSPDLVISAGIPQVVWSEKDFPSSTKHVYVKGRDTSGLNEKPVLSRYGSSGPSITIVPNTWTSMNPGGLAVGASGVYDEGFSTFIYSPTLGSGLVFGKYHAVGVAEEQNALLGYNFPENRWDLIEITEAAGSEYLPGVGHDSGNAAINTLHGLYITHGNFTLNSGLQWQTYVYDLAGGWGKRMMPPSEINLTAQVASAFDPDHDIMLSFGLGDGPSAWTYDHKTNQWFAVPNSPPGRTHPGLVYDSLNHVFVMFGGALKSGEYSSETWIYDPAAGIWSNKMPNLSPPAKRAPYMAFDSTNGIVLMTGGKSSEVWAYNAALNEWTQLAHAPEAVASMPTGAYLTYDSNNKIFLLFSGTSLKKLWAFRYSSHDTAADIIPPSTPADLKGMAASPGEVLLSWSASSDDVGVHGYRIYRDGTKIADTSTCSYGDTGLLAATTYTYYLLAYDAVGNLSSPSQSVAITTPASITPTLSIPITVAEPAGASRVNAPITSGIPLPPGTQINKWSLWEGDRQIPLQFSSMQGSATWLLLDFQASINPGTEKTFVLRDIASAELPAKPVAIDENELRILVRTGPLQVQISKTVFNLLDSVWLDRDSNGQYDESEQIIASAGDNLLLVDGITGTTCLGNGTPDKIAWEYQGPIRSTLRVDGRYTIPNLGSLAYTTRISFFAGRTDLKIEHVLRNSKQNNERHLKIKSALLRFGNDSTLIRAPRSGSMSWVNHTSAGEAFEIVPATYGTINWEADNGMLLPDLSYHGATITIDFAEGLSGTEQTNRASSAKSPLLAIAPSRYYADCGQLTGGNFSTIDDEKQAYAKWGWTWSASQEPTDSHKPDYDVGWNVIDVHNDSESDDLWQNLIMYLRTGQRGYFDRAKAWARYYKWDYAYRTDGFNYAWNSSWEGATNAYARPALSIALTETDALHLNKNVLPGKLDIRNWGADHLYGWGLLDYYFITGDLDAIEAAKDIGEVSERIFSWRQEGEYAMAFYGGRQGARHLLLMTRLFEVTQDARWEASMNHLAQLWLKSPDWDDRGFYYSGDYYTNSVLGAGAFAAGARNAGMLHAPLINKALDRYYNLTKDLQARDRLIAQAQWVRKYALDSTYQYASSDIALDYPEMGSVWQKYFFKTPLTSFYHKPTIWPIDMLVCGFRLTGDASYLEQAILHWNRGSKVKDGVPITRFASDTQVGNFMNSEFTTSGNCYADGGDLVTAHLLFYEVVNQHKIQSISPPSELRIVH